MTITLSDESLPFLMREAERKGISVETYAQMILEKECQRLYYVERSQPKDKRPPGRPNIAPDIKKCKEIAGKILPIYIRKREVFANDPAAFTEVYGEQEDKLKKAIDENDLQTLLWFDRVQPWVKRHVTITA